jgi:hypothetical protein
MVQMPWDWRQVALHYPMADGVPAGLLLSGG